MEDRRFDTVAKAFGSGTTRRRVLAALLGVVGSGAIFAGAHEVSAAPHFHVSCVRGQRRCGGACYFPEDQCCFRCPGVDPQVLEGVDTCQNALCFR